MSAESGPAETGKSASHHICFRVDGEVKRVWDLLSKSDKLALTRFFRDAVASYSSTKSVISLGLRDVAELASILKAGYDSCKDALRRCEERCGDIDEVRAECKNRVAECEELVAKLKAAVAEKDAEIAKLRAQLSALSQLSRLRLAICVARDEEPIKSILREHGLEKVCD
jgi:uncharacterized coiled-coil protein SlyX